MMKNITLSADDEVIAKARSYAKEHNKTINQLIRDYLVELVELQDREKLVEQFDELVRKNACYPEKGWRFNREEIHERGGKGE
ncbi:MAG: DUF6364 family protein [Thermoguttaceae bacterium]|jgi:hypothetical protein